MAERKDEKLANNLGSENRVESGQLRRGETSEKITGEMGVRETKVDHEVEKWMEKIEKDPQQIQDQQMGGAKTGLQAVSSRPSDIFVIPVSRKKFLSGFKQGVDDVAKWLSVFILRVIKKKDGKVKFSTENE